MFSSLGEDFWENVELEQKLMYDFLCPSGEGGTQSKQLWRKRELVPLQIWETGMRESSAQNVKSGALDQTNDPSSMQSCLPTKWMFKEGNGNRMGI